MLLLFLSLRSPKQLRFSLGSREQLHPARRLYYKSLLPSRIDFIGFVSPGG